MIKVSIKRSGSFDVNDITQKVMRMAEDKIAADFERKLAGVSCPEHGTQPVIELAPKPGGYDVKLTNQCCDAFAELCSSKIKVE